MKGAFLLNVVIRKSPAVIKLLSCEDKTLLIRRDALLVLDFRLHIFDGVGRFHVESDGFSRKGLHEDLHFRKLAKKLGETQEQPETNPPVSALKLVCNWL